MNSWNDPKAMAWLVKTTKDTLGITELAAELRIKALYKSGVLDRFESFDDPLFQFTVDVAIRIPQTSNENGEFN